MRSEADITLNVHLTQGRAFATPLTGAESNLVVCNTLVLSLRVSAHNLPHAWLVRKKCSDEILEEAATHALT